jgi:hypothetical protein
LSEYDPVFASPVTIEEVPCNPFVPLPTPHSNPVKLIRDGGGVVKLVLAEVDAVVDALVVMSN